MARSKVLIDLSPFRRFPQFRLLWSGFLIRTVGNQLTVVTEGNNNTVIVNSTQNNSGNVSASSSLNGGVSNGQ